MGILDLPAPLLSQVDTWLGGYIPEPAALLFWAAVCALCSMEIYRLYSPQRRVARCREELQEAQQALDEFDGSPVEAWPRIRRMLGLALQRVLLVLPASLLASLPIIMVVVWLENSHGPRFPAADEPVSVVAPGDFEALWLGPGPDRTPPRVEVRNRDRDVIAEVPVTAPAESIHKRQWWNALTGNPAGYLADELPFDHLAISLPRKEYLSLGPAWLRGWELLFFLPLFAFAVILKIVRRIE